MHPFVFLAIVVAMVLLTYSIIGPRVARRYWVQFSDEISFEEFYSSYASYWVVGKRGLLGVSIFRNLKGEFNLLGAKPDIISDSQKMVVKNCQRHLGRIQGIAHLFAVAAWFAFAAYHATTP